MKWFGYFVKYWVPVIILAGVIFWLSGANFTDGKTSEFFFPKIKSLFPGLSPESVTFVHELIRSLAHVVEYFLLGLFLTFAVRRLPLQISSLKKNVLIVVLLVIFVLGDEVRQSLVTLRSASLVDVGLDLVGGVLGMGIVRQAIRLKTEG